jgi:hypothetical protein
MIDLTLSFLPIAAVGYSLIYLLFGGGLVGAVVIFSSRRCSVNEFTCEKPAAWRHLFFKP